MQMMAPRPVRVKRLGPSERRSVETLRSARRVAVTPPIRRCREPQLSPGGQGQQSCATPQWLSIKARAGRRCRATRREQSLGFRGSSTEVCLSAAGALSSSCHLRTTASVSVRRCVGRLDHEKTSGRHRRRNCRRDLRGHLLDLVIFQRKRHRAAKDAVPGDASAATAST